MKNRIEFCALKAAVAVMSLGLSAPVVLAQPPQRTPQVATTQPAATVIRTPSRGTKAASKASRPPAGTAPLRTNATKPPVKAPALKLETKEAARQVVRNDHAARQRLVTVDVSPQIAPNVMKNLYEPLVPPPVAMGDRPARSLGLCGDGKNRRFAELDSKTVAALLPEFNALRPRTVCARRGVVIADYAFK